MFRIFPNEEEFQGKYLLDIFFEAEKRIDVSSYNLYNQRVFGFISEQMLKVWTQKNGLKIYEGKVGITAEKAETVEFKLAMGQLVKMGKIDYARQMFYEYLKLRPDVRLELSDIRGEIPIIEQLLYIACEENRRGLSGLMGCTNDLNEWIAHYRRTLECLSRFSKGEKRRKDEEYIMQKGVTYVMTKVMLINTPVGIIENPLLVSQVLHEIYRASKMEERDL